MTTNPKVTHPIFCLYRMFPHTQFPSLIDRESSLEHRLKMLDYFVAIAGAVWTFAAVFYALRNNVAVSAAATLGSLICFAMFVCIRRRPRSRSLFANLFIASSVITLCVCTAMSFGSYSHASMYFPIVVLLAAQLVGFRVAAVWTVCLIIAAWHDNRHFATSTLVHDMFRDRFFHTTATTLTALWLSYEAEKFFNLRTRSLQALADSLQEKTRLLELAEETAGVGHWRWDLNTNDVSLSTEARGICELDPNASTQGMDNFIGVWEHDFKVQLQEQLHNAKDQGEDFEQHLSFQSLSGIRHVSCRGLCERDPDGNVVGVFGTLRDDTQLRIATDRLSRKAEQLNKLASFDPLTGLTNRFQFQQQLGTIVSRAIDQDRKMALLVLDMDGFKEINDTMGHQAGDEVLKIVAQRLKEVVRDGDVISRLGGDEFTVILRDTVDETEVETISRRLVDAIMRPMQIDNQELHVGVSIGASLCPTDSDRPDELFTYADTAMYEAKGKKQGLAMYNPSMTEQLRSRRSDENRLVGALDREEFRLVYQPQSDIATGAITGFECLLRWKNDGEEIPPLKFIPLLEGSGKIIEVGQWVLEQSCQQLARWHKDGHDLKMAINISPIQFREPEFAARVIETLEHFDVPASCIELEITEGLLIQDLENTAEKLFQLKSSGVRISVDDFGTGYSSLAYLKHLPLDQLKIDRAFIKDIPNHDDGTIASSIIVLGQSLDMEVLAEGVETQAQLDFLRSQDCHAFQGNLLSKPLEASDCRQLIETHQVAAAAL